MSETATRPSHPATMLLNLIITLLTPMFLAAAGGNLAFAREAAAETLNAYRAETSTDLITIAKIIGFGLAALGRSMAEDLPVTTMLRLHASACATDRAEHRNRQALKQRPVFRPPPAPEPDIDVAALTAAAADDMKQRTTDHLARFAPPAPAPVPVPAPIRTVADIERQYQATWAASAASIAVETAATLSTLPPDERAYAATWINVLNDCAKEFMEGAPLPPRLRPGDLAGIMPPNP